MSTNELKELNTARADRMWRFHQGFYSGMMVIITEKPAIVVSARTTFLRRQYTFLDNLCKIICYVVNLNKQQHSDKPKLM